MLHRQSSPLGVRPRDAVFWSVTRDKRTSRDHRKSVAAGPLADVGGKVADTTRTPFHQSELFCFALQLNRLADVALSLWGPCPPGDSLGSCPPTVGGSGSFGGCTNVRA